jgi:hypothetical protein
MAYNRQRHHNNVWDRCMEAKKIEEEPNREYDKILEVELAYIDRMFSLYADFVNKTTI